MITTDIQALIAEAQAQRGIKTRTAGGVVYTFSPEAGQHGSTVYAVTAKMTDGREVLCFSHRNKARAMRYFEAQR